LQDIHFLAGVRGPANKGHGTAKCLHFPKNYEYLAPGKPPSTLQPQRALRTLARDVVIIVLNEKLPVEPVTLAEDVIAQSGLRLVHVAYPADRRFLLSAHFNCQLLRASLEGLWFNDCDTHPASSGGPMFIQTDGTFRLAAIMVAAGDGLSNAALPVLEWSHLLHHTGCP
jgi:hypothetical protein